MFEFVLFFFFFCLRSLFSSFFLVEAHMDLVSDDPCHSTLTRFFYSDDTLHTLSLDSIHGRTRFLVLFFVVGYDLPNN